MVLFDTPLDLFLGCLIRNILTSLLNKLNPIYYSLTLDRPLLLYILDIVILALSDVSLTIYVPLNIAHFPKLTLCNGLSPSTTLLLLLPLRVIISQSLENLHKPLTLFRASCNSSLAKFDGKDSAEKLPDVVDVGLDARFSLTSLILIVKQLLSASNYQGNNKIVIKSDFAI